MKDLRKLIRAELDRTLEEEIYSYHSELIRDLLKNRSGKYVIESIEDVEQAVKEAFDTVNMIRSAEIKSLITKEPSPLTELEIYRELFELQIGITCNVRTINHCENELRKEMAEKEKLLAELRDRA